jgi:RNA-directed DNA polymerase
MDWFQYVKQFKQQAKKVGFDGDYVHRCLTYANNLYQKGLPIIYDQRHLSLLVGYSADYIYKASNSPQHFYRYFEIPKHTGGVREIAEPLPSLKEIQKWILTNILYRCDPSKFAKAYVPKRSIRENARFHRRQPMVLSLDVENFFGSISSAKVYRFYNKLGYCKSVATILTELCTLDRSLPQGAPTSPAISNLLSLRIDHRLSGYALKNRIRYTRYADDLTFSGKFDVGTLINLVINVLTDAGLSLNVKKTRLMLGHNRQEVTGIVVNEKMQAPREVRSKLRQAIYYIEKYGLDSHMEFTSETRANYINHLRGIANFILFVNPKDTGAKHAFEILSKF